MIVTFCGHADVAESAEVRQWLCLNIEQLVSAGAKTFYLGGYGGYDLLAAAVLSHLKSSYPQIEIVRILAYPPRTSEDDDGLYDSTIYPPLENVPPRYAILRRNKWIVEHSDIVLAYITHDWGGAYKTYQYALKKGKRILLFEKNKSTR